MKETKVLPFGALTKVKDPQDYSQDRGGDALRRVASSGSDMFRLIALRTWRPLGATR